MDEAWYILMFCKQTRSGKPVYANVISMCTVKCILNLQFEKKTFCVHSCVQCTLYIVLYTVYLKVHNKQIE